MTTPDDSNNTGDSKNVDSSNNDTGGSGIRLIDTAAAVSSARGNSNENNSVSQNQQQNNTAATTVGSTTITGLPLDWTQMSNGADAAAPPVRYPTDVSPDNRLDVTDGELVLVGTAGQKITHMGPDLSTLLIKACQEQGVVDGMKKIILRSHLIHDMIGLDGLPPGCLQLLELYDNQVQALVLTPNLSTSLTVLDMSYNAIRDMAPVANCPNLRELYLANNKLKAIAGLSGLSQLQKLDLGANRIRSMPAEELSGLHQIQELWLGKNKIEVINGLSTLTKLRRLDLQSNRLEQLPRAQFVTIAPTLEELYLAHNGLTSVSEGGWLDMYNNDDKGNKLEFPELMVLDLSRNQLTAANALGSATTFPLLEELWLSGNQITEWSAVQELKALTTLETVYLEYNPIQTTDPLYRKTLAQLIPQLKQIDATMISATPSMLGTSGLVRGAGSVPVESEQDRLRRFQEMALQRAEQESRAKEEADDSDDSGDDSGAGKGTS